MNETYFLSELKALLNKYELLKKPSPLRVGDRDSSIRRLD